MYVPESVSIHKCEVERLITPEIRFSLILSIYTYSAFDLLYYVGHFYSLRRRFYVSLYG